MPYGCAVIGSLRFAVICCNRWRAEGSGHKTEVGGRKSEIRGKIVDFGFRNADCGFFNRQWALKRLLFNLTLHVVDGSQEEECGLKYVMQSPKRRVEEFTYLRSAATASELTIKIYWAQKPPYSSKVDNRLSSLS